MFGEPVLNVRELRINPNTGFLDRTNGDPTGSFRGSDASGTVVLFQPPEEHRGNVARAMFYMSVRYWWQIPDLMEDTLKQWHVDDPVDAAEEARNGRIRLIQGNLNPFIEDPNLVDLIADF